MEKSIIDDETGGSPEYIYLIKRDKHRIIWMKYVSKTLGRLAQGVGDIVKMTNAIFSLEHDKTPTERKKDVTYRNIVCNYIPQKYKPRHTRLVSGGILISFSINVSAITDNITTAKLLVNSTIYTKCEKFLCCGI